MLDWRTVRDTIDLAEAVARLLGPAPGRRGERGRRLWWPCPLGTHEDRNPSFSVRPGDSAWRCYGCGERGDAVALVRRLNPSLSFREAVALLTGGPAPSGKPTPRPGPPAKSPAESPTGPEGMPEADALALVADAGRRLWSPEGADALAYLRSRGLRDETIRAARLGWSPRVQARTLDGRPYTARGIVILWFDGDRLALVKIRQPEGAKPKYAQVFRDRDRPPLIYPGRHVIRPGCTLVIVEGEADALLLGQELTGLAAVVTLGSASARPGPTILGSMLTAFPWYVATDNDSAGDKAAADWPTVVRRVRPPGPHKDWTEAHQGGVNLVRWWSDVLAGYEAPPLFSWDDLAALRWGPARDDPTPGIIIDQPDRSRMLVALQAPADDPYAIAERLAIQGESGD